MTREEKKIKRLERAYRRKGKRIEKDRSYLATASRNGRSSISWGRKRENGSVFVCEMGYYECERRMYCNGDC